MRYRKPFTLVQRQAAITVYRSMQVTWSNIRHHFRPLDKVERGLAREFRETVRDFADTLRAKDVRMNVSR